MAADLIFLFYIIAHFYTASFLIVIGKRGMKILAFDGIIILIGIIIDTWM